VQVIGIIGAGTLSLLLGIAATGFAQEQRERQQDQHEQQQEQKDRAAQQQEKKDATAREPSKAGESRLSARKGAAGEQVHTARAQRTTTASPEQQRVEQGAWQEHRARSWQSDHRTWQQRGGYIRMHFALLNTSSGRPLSGVDMMACTTSTDFCRRSTVSSLAEPAHARVPIRPTKAISNSDTVCFKNVFLS